MNYSQSLNYLNSFYNFERVLHYPNNRAWNLKRMQILLDWAGHPEKNFFPVLIAGTKGKGSTGFFLESILSASGISAGFYSSPHLETPRERIRLNGRMISESAWTRGFEKIKSILERHSLPKTLGDFTYFEIMTLLALLVFKERKVKIGIFEAGMGGRLDATNVLNAKIAILTPVYLDHEAFLGNTIAKIAREKVAIVRPGADVVVSPQLQEADQVIRQDIDKKRARLWPVVPIHNRELGLQGDYQTVNAGAALQVARLLEQKYGFQIREKDGLSGLTRKNWPGRWELLEKDREYLLDGAHNPSSIEALVRNLKKQFAKRESILIFGTSRDKKSAAMLKALSGFFDKVILSPTINPRTREVGNLLAESRNLFKMIFPVSGVQEALELSRKLSESKTLIVITGSFYLIGEARKALNHA